ncbi:MAG TPA: winged helix-turn-helix domain-containing protein, partial [Acetobacteraceae bacterium]|nr:winged helix-turn-helix domain-containing protein [Acetobacteraceae bacterium]
MDARAAHDVFLFGGFRLDRQSGGLFRQDEAGGEVPLAIGSRALDVLAVLVSHPGELLSKQAIMQAVWPGITVDEKNLTVQIATLRRALDNGGTDRSCIQTEAGRGYRFVAPVARVSGDDKGSAATEAFAAGSSVSAATAPNAATSAIPPRLRWRRASALGALAVFVLVVGLGGAWFATGGRPEQVLDAAQDSSRPSAAAPAPAPRLSLVVLPFQNLSGDVKDDYLADAITDDLTSDLSLIPVAFVIARQSAYTYRGKATDVRQIGTELGVRYVIEGSVRKLGATLRVNVQLTSAETGAHLWSDRFDQDIRELAAGQEQIVTRMRSELGISMVQIEVMRSLREHPGNPDTFDLNLRARALGNLPPSTQRNDEVQLLYEQALELDPSSVPALLGISYYLIDKAATVGHWGSVGDLRRAENLLQRAHAVAPHSRDYLSNMAYWLRTRGRCDEAIALAEETIRRFPNNAAAYSQLAQCKIIVGKAAEAIPLMEQAIRVSPRSPYMYNRYRVMGYASVLLGKDSEAIAYYERTLAATADDDGNRQWTLRGLAVAHARSGHIPDAKRALAEANRIWPYDTVRRYSPGEGSSAVFAAQLRSYQDGLRLAGERDHADEDADFGVPADERLHGEPAGPTPTTVPGVRTIRTGDLVAHLAEARPVVIDTLTYSWGRSIPGAVGLKFSGLGGSFADEAQDRLRRKMAELTAGDLHRPVVTVGWNSERFDGRNLALRLVALGYTQVYWYRGGREAWESAELPETELA